MAVVSPFPIVAWGLQRLISDAQPRMAVTAAAASPAAALAVLDDAAPQVVVVDVDGDDGMEAVSALAAATTARLLAITASQDATTQDLCVLAGASGLVRKTDPVEILLKAIERIHEGEIWVDRKAAGRIFFELARKKSAEQAPDPEAGKIAQLTRKERMAVVEIARDAAATPAQIAARLHISESTLRNHLTAIYAKLEVANRLELYAYANRHGLHRA